MTLFGIVLSLEHVDVILSHIFPMLEVGRNCCPLCGSSCFVHCMPLASAEAATVNLLGFVPQLMKSTLYSAA